MLHRDEKPIAIAGERIRDVPVGERAMLWNHTYEYAYPVLVLAYEYAEADDERRKEADYRYNVLVLREEKGDKGYVGGERVVQCRL